MSHLRVIDGGGADTNRSGFGSLRSGGWGTSDGPRSGSATSVRVEAPGKINLYLSVGALRDDGYHPLSTVFQAVRLIETVTARRQCLGMEGYVTFDLTEYDPAVPDDERNIAVKAALILSDYTEVYEGVDLLVRKRVPVAGGMAGGSADAAATLVACNHLWNTGVSQEELLSLAALLGADCPFPLLGSTALGDGRGDKLTGLMTRGTYQWVLAFDAEGLSTPAVFAEYDRLTAQRGGAVAPTPIPDELTAALRRGDIHALADTMHNDLQAAAVSLRPRLGEVIEVAKAAGALNAIVSGSGPTIAALAPDSMTAMRIRRRLERTGLVASTRCVDGPVAGARVVR